MKLIRDHRKKLAASVIVVVALAGACALKSGKTPEGIMAEYSLKGAKLVKATQDAVRAVGIAPGVALPIREGSVKALEAIDVVSAKQQQLSPILRSIDAARQLQHDPPKQELAAAWALVLAIDDEILLKVIPSLGAHPETAAALKAARELQKLHTTIQIELSRFKGSPVA